MNCCRAFIVRSFRSLPPGTIFTTRDCLGFGFRRDNVDQTLARLVKEGVLIRLVRGVFVDAATARPTYSILEIATVKASSFGKKIRQHSADSAAEIGLPAEMNKHDTFIVDGATSRFHVISTGKRVVFRIACEKKMHLDDDKVGKIVRGLWHLGEERVQLQMIARAVITLNRAECRKIVTSGAWMPYWLMNAFEEIFGRRFLPPMWPVQPSGPPAAI